MQLSQEQVFKLIKGNYTFSLWSMSMLITRLKRVYADDSSPSSLTKCTSEMNTFVNKFKSVMGNDYLVLQKL